MMAMSNVKFWALGLCLFLGFSCQIQQQAEDVLVVSVDISSADTKNLEGKFDIVEIVPLETTKASILHDLKKVAIGKDYIVTVKGGVQLWSRDGRFIRNIGRYGNGPNEYISISNIQFNEGEKRIYLHDRTRQRMMVYNLEGEVISTMNKPMWIDSFCKTEDGYWVYVPTNWSSAGFALILLDNNFDKIVGEFFPQQAFFRPYSALRFFSDDKGEYYFAYPFSNVVYHLKGGKPQPWLEVDFGDRTLPYDEIRTTTDVALYDRIDQERKYLGNIENLVFCDGAVAFTFSEKVPLREPYKSYRAMYYLVERHLKLYNNSTEVVSADPNSLYPITRIALDTPVTSSGGLWVYSIDPDDLFNEDLKLLKEKVSPLIDFDSNPLLFFVKQSR
jgi:hypothetical protein